MSIPSFALYSISKKNVVGNVSLNIGKNAYGIRDSHDAKTDNNNVKKVVLL